MDDAGRSREGSRAVPPPLPVDGSAGAGVEISLTVDAVGPSRPVAAPPVTGPWAPAQGVLAYAGPRGGGRPGIIIAVAVLAFVLAAWMLYLGAVAAMGVAKWAEIRANQSGRAPEIQSYYAAIQMRTGFYALANLGLTAWLVIVGVGSLKGARWAWKAAVVYAIAHLAWLVVGRVMQFAWILPLRNAAFGPAVRGPIMTMTEIFYVLVQAIVPVFILIAYTRPAVRRAFGRAG